MKRLDYLQQKLPLSLHRAGMLEGSEILVCSISHTFAYSTLFHGSQKRPGEFRETQSSCLGCKVGGGLPWKTVKGLRGVFGRVLGTAEQL